MGKSKTRSKSTRSARDKRVARARRARESRRGAMIEREAHRRFDELFGDAVPVERSAELLLAHREGGMVPARMCELFALESSPARARAVSAELSRRAPASATALSFAADVAAHLDQDWDAASALLDEIPALARDAEPVMLAGHLLSIERTAGAMQLLDSVLAETPEDSRAQSLRAATLEAAHVRRVRHDTGLCDCDAGEGCCPASDREALVRFEDREPLYALRRAMRRFTATDPRARAGVDEAVSRWTQETGELDGVGDPEALTTMAIEHAWLVGGEDDADDDGAVPLARFAAAHAASAQDALLARRWLAHLEYGLWQVTDPTPAPGVWLTDLATGRRRYAAIPPEQLEGTARWTVLLGALVAVDGVWRTTDTLLTLRPREADEVTDLAREMLYAIVAKMSGEPLDPPPRPALPEPHGVLIAETEPSPEEVADLQSKVLGAGMPQLLRLIATNRNVAPQMVNTDGDPLCLVEATVAVSKAAAAFDALAAHPDFERDGDALTWRGRELDALERETSLAEVRAHFRAQGETLEVTEPDEARRWVRGQIHRDHAGLRVDVNSKERLERFLDVLRGLGEQPDATRTLVIDPAQDLPQLRSGSMLAFAGSPDANEAWAARWPDQPLPELAGNTPRRAARRPQDQPYLEALLRDLEHDADLLTQAGRSAPDIDRLRDTLGMSAHEWT